jgi:ADP-ribose pyrophosphatase
MSETPAENDGCAREGRDDTPPPFEPFLVRSSERIYDSHWVGLRRDLLALPDGATQDHHVVEIIDAVVVVPVMSDGRIAMIWQYRYPHGKSHWEVPAGRLNPGEDPNAGVVRELREETGCVAGRLLPMNGFYPINGISAHWAHAYVAVECEQLEALDLDDTERLSVHLLERDRVRELLHSGAIEDGFSALALYQLFSREELCAELWGE